MSERRFEHTVDLAEVARVGAKYEKAIEKGHEVIHSLEPFDGDDKAWELATLAGDALTAAGQMFRMVLPPEVFSEFQALLEEAVKASAVEV